MRIRFGFRDRALQGGPLSGLLSSVPPGFHPQSFACAKYLQTPLPLSRSHVSMMATMFQAPLGVTRRGSAVPGWRREGGRRGLVDTVVLTRR